MGGGGKCGLRCGWVVEVNVEVRCVRVDFGGKVHDEHSDPTCMTCSTNTDSCVTYSKHGFYKLHAQLENLAAACSLLKPLTPIHSCELDLW